jgi:hypothetical protein
MLIEFKIQLDENGGATVIPASANAINPNLPKELQLGSFAGAPAAAAARAAAQKGGAAPIDPPGTGLPPGAVSSSGSGMVFVIGPIVICGSGPGHSGPGGAAPIDPPGTGKPKAGN